jgi:hypothetical protein
MNSPNFLRTVIALGLPLAAIASIILAISYVNDQQTLRTLANEPQEYVARDAALRVQAAGALPTGGFTNAIPIEADPAAYLLFYDATGSPVAGTGVLHGKAPTLPAGVLDVAKAKGVNRLTWQPEAGVRQALVVLPAGTGFVVAGRSLIYTEQLESDLTKRALLGWLGTMIAVVVMAFIGAWLLRRREN